MTMSPRAYADKSSDLEVYLYSGTGEGRPARAAAAGRRLDQGQCPQLSAEPRAYRRPETSLAVFKSKTREHLKGKDGKITVWVKTIAGDIVSKTYHSRLELAENVNDPFYGKGSPEEVQVVLQLAVRYGVFPREKVQIYCDNGNIGLDCNGFVGNYLRHVRQGLPWDVDARTSLQKKTEFDANSTIRSIMKGRDRNRTQPVNTIEEGMQQNTWSVHLLAMANAHGTIHDQVRDSDGTVSHGHIMISEPGPLWWEKPPHVPGLSTQPERALSMTVLESSGRVGLVESKYFILNANSHGAFLVYRGSKAETMTVTAARLL